MLSEMLPLPPGVSVAVLSDAPTVMAGLYALKRASLVWSAVLPRNATALYRKRGAPDVRPIWLARTGMITFAPLVGAVTRKFVNAAAPVAMFTTTAR